MNARIDETNRWVDGLYTVIVRRGEYEKLEVKIMGMEREMGDIKERIKKDSGIGIIFIRLIE